MKKSNLSRLFRMLFLLACLCGARTLSAQIFAQDDAAKPAYNNSWATGTNGGTGFGPWTLFDNSLPASNDFSGFFIGSSGVAVVDVTNKSFGIYANGTDYNYAIAHRTFSNALTAGKVFTFKFKNNSIAPGKMVGFSLFNGTTFTQTNDFNTLAGAARFNFYFVGGNLNYTIWDGGGAFLSDVPYHGDGLTLEFALRTADTYRFTIKSADGSAILFSYDDFPLQGSGPIDSFACYVIDNDEGNSGNLYVNQFQVAATTLVPPVIQHVLPTNGSFYLPTATTITFDTSSAFSTITTNDIKVALNGSNVTAFAFSGASTNWSVTASPVLATNVTYNAVITVTDVNGNTVTNAFQFNTWSPNNLYIEAEAYNYSGGGYIPNPFPGQYDTFTSVAAVSNIDFIDLPDGGTNEYRTNDAVDLEISGDSADHANYQALALVNWSLDYIQSGEWLNYTRRLPTNTAYNVYARYSGGFAPVILIERAASATATTANQPRAALGTFIGTDTGNIVSNYAFAPLKDFFGNLVAVRFNQATNTFRLSRLGDGYNLDYFTFVPITDTNIQRPYISAGYPFPNASGVLPDEKISFTIANRQTTNVTASTKLFVNGADVSSSLTFTNHAAGTIVTYQPLALYPLNTSNTVRAVFTDSGSVTQTNDWVFYTADVLIVPPAYALTSGSGLSNGFNLHLVKYPDVWPADAAPTPLSSAWAEAVLAGAITNTITSLPYPPDTNVFFAETNTINYEICGTNSPDGYTFSNEVAFPYVSLTPYAPCSYTNGPNNFTFSATMYVELTAGLYQWAVRSDDGFRLATGTGAVPTNTLIMDWEGGRGAQTPSVFSFIVQTSGLYPMRLLYYQGGFGGSVELYSINRTTGQPTLINDPADVNSIKVFRASTAAIVLLNPQHTGNTSTFSFLTQSGQTHIIQYKTNLSAAVWQTLKVVTGNGATTNITDTTATNGARYYRVSTP